MPASHRDETIRLSSLGLTPTRGVDVAVTGLCLDSRKIKQGDIEGDFEESSLVVNFTLEVVSE